MPSFTVLVDGLSTSHGARRLVEEALAGDAGVIRLHVSLPMETVHITYDPTLTEPERLVSALAAAGLQIRTPWQLRRPGAESAAVGPATADPTAMIGIARAGGAGAPRPVHGNGLATAGTSRNTGWLARVRAGLRSVAGTIEAVRHR